MTEISMTEARDRLPKIVDEAAREPVYLTRHNRPVAAVVSADTLAQLLEDAEDLADIRAVDEAWKETDELDETPVPWDDVRRELGL